MPLLAAGGLQPVEETPLEPANGLRVTGCGGFGSGACERCARTGFENMHLEVKPLPEGDERDRES